MSERDERSTRELTFFLSPSDSTRRSLRVRLQESRTGPLPPYRFQRSCFGLGRSRRSTLGHHPHLGSSDLTRSSWRFDPGSRLELERNFACYRECRTVISTSSRFESGSSCDPKVDELTFVLPSFPLSQTSRDKKLRLFDPRSGTAPIRITDGHAGVKGSRVAWLGVHDRIVTTGCEFRRVSFLSFFPFSDDATSRSGLQSARRLIDRSRFGRLEG